MKPASSDRCSWWPAGRGATTGWWAISRATRRPSRPARSRPRPTRRTRRPSASGDVSVRHAASDELGGTVVSSVPRYGNSISGVGFPFPPSSGWPRSTRSGPLRTADEARFTAAGRADDTARGRGGDTRSGGAPEGRHLGRRRRFIGRYRARMEPRHRRRRRAWRAGAAGPVGRRRAAGARPAYSGLVCGVGRRSGWPATACRHRAVKHFGTQERVSGAVGGRGRRPWRELGLQGRTLNAVQAASGAGASGGSGGAGPGGRYGGAGCLHRRSAGSPG